MIYYPELFPSLPIFSAFRGAWLRGNPQPGSPVPRSGDGILSFKEELQSAGKVAPETPKEAAQQSRPWSIS